MFVLVRGGLHCFSVKQENYTLLSQTPNYHFFSVYCRERPGFRGLMLL